MRIISLGPTITVAGTLPMRLLPVTRSCAVTLRNVFIVIFGMVSYGLPS